MRYSALQKEQKWKEVQKFVRERDKECRVMPILDITEWKAVNDYLYAFYPSCLDCAHILGRDVAPNLIYEPKNIVLIQRAFHIRLDKYQDLVTGKSVGKEGRVQWCIRLIGKDVWDELQELREKQ